MTEEQPVNRITVEQAKIIVDALQPEDSDEDEYSTEYEYEEEER